MDWLSTSNLGGQLTLAGAFALVVILVLYWTLRTRCYGDMMAVSEIQYQDNPAGDEEPIILIKGRKAGPINLLMSALKMGTRITLMVNRKEARISYYSGPASSMGLSYFQSLPLRQRPSVAGDLITPTVGLVVTTLVVLLGVFLGSLFTGQIITGFLMLLGFPALFIWFLLSRSFALVIKGRSSMTIRLKQPLFASSPSTPQQISEVIDRIRDFVVLEKIPAPPAVPTDTAGMSQVAFDWETQVQQLLGGLESLARQQMRRSAFLRCLEAVRLGYPNTQGTARIDVLRDNYADQLSDAEADREGEAQRLDGLFRQIAAQANMNGSSPMPEIVAQTFQEVISEYAGRGTEQRDWSTEVELESNVAEHVEPATNDGREAQVKYLLDGLSAIAQKGMQRSVFWQCLQAMRKSFGDTQAIVEADILWQTYSQTLHDESTDAGREATELDKLFRGAASQAAQLNQPPLPKSIFRLIQQIISHYYPKTPAAARSRSWLEKQKA